VKKIPLTLIFLLHAFCLFAAEYTDGRIQLVIHENTGRFSLYFMADTAREKYSSFFVNQDPRTSFLALMVNEQNYKLGESSAFKTRLGGTPSAPAIIFESSFLTVTEEFSFVKTPGSSLVNGVRITITMSNRSEQAVQAGARLLIDTNLGEGDTVHFATDRRQISAETVIDGASGDLYWVSKNKQLGLMGSLSGSLSGGDLTKPDLVHFANWKRLNDAPWKMAFSGGRNFNMLPYSVGDSAVCYYYDPVTIGKGGSRKISLILASEDENGFNLIGGTPAAVPTDVSSPVPAESFRPAVQSENGSPAELMDADLIALGNLIAKIDEYVSAGASISDEEMAALESAVSRLKTRYNQP
jgi:hypothetical protein